MHYNIIHLLHCSVSLKYTKKISVRNRYAYQKYLTDKLCVLPNYDADYLICIKHIFIVSQHIYVGQLTIWRKLHSTIIHANYLYIQGQIQLNGKQKLPTEQRTAESPRRGDCLSRRSIPPTTLPSNNVKIRAKKHSNTPFCGIFKCLVRITGFEPARSPNGF